MKPRPSLPVAWLLLAVLTTGTDACSSMSKSNGSTPPTFSNTVPDRA